MELKQAIEEYCSSHQQALLKYTSKCEIVEWQDLTTFNLYKFRDYLLDNVAPNSAKTYLAVFKSMLNRVYEEYVNEISKEYKSILKAKGDKPVKVFLDKNELKKLEQVELKSELDRQVHATFMISAYTGCRLSDAKDLTLDNIEDGVLHYTSHKTSVTAHVPCGEKLKNWIIIVNNLNRDILRAEYNYTIRKLCKRAGIEKKCVVFHAGQQSTKKKYECVSSHTGRISFATNLSLMKVPILDISKMMGHSNTIQTERYIVPTRVELTEQVMSFLTK